MNPLLTIGLYFLAPINAVLLVLFFARPWLPAWASRIGGDRLVTSLAVLVVLSIVVLLAWGMTLSAASWRQVGRAAILAAAVVGLTCLVAVGYLFLVLSSPL